MTKIVLDMSMSLNGFVASLNNSPELPYGKDGDDILMWLFNGKFLSKYTECLHLSRINKDVFDTALSETGAMIVGKKTFEIMKSWAGEHPARNTPVFVVTSEVPKEPIEGEIEFIFVTEGIEKAVQEARKVAQNKNIRISSASIAAQCINAEVLDEMQLHLSPVLLREGINLFDNIDKEKIHLEQIDSIKGDGVVHLKYRVLY